jgi:RNA polymerase sigma factor (sigma-70 family)
MTIRVLLVDDHAMMRSGLKALLEEAGISVVGEAGDGRAALQRAIELKPDVVVMDISMPDMNGIEAARLLRDKCPATRVVMLSMHSSSEHVFRAFEAGAAGYLLKESVGAELEAAVRAVHGGNRYISNAIASPESAARSHAEISSPLERLTARERQVLQLVVEGMSSAEIAQVVFISRKSVESYRSRLMKKLGISDVPALVKFAILHGITPPD